MEKVLVTGAYGFLGKYVIDELVQHGYQVKAFGRKIDLLKSLEAENVEIFQGDFCVLEDCFKAMEDVDYVIHCGALSTVWGKREDFIKTNVHGTMNLVQAGKEKGIQRFIYVSSPSIYAGRQDKKKLGYEPQMTLVEGMEKYAKEYHQS